jgi:ankyrin repeat protein
MVDARDAKGRTPLTLAASRGHKQPVSVLLEHGADINTTDEHLRTPLHQAAEGGYEPVVSLLLKAGAKPNVLDKNRDTPLHLAANGETTRHQPKINCWHRRTAESSPLMKGANAPQNRRFEERGGHYGVVEQLLKAGAWIEARNSYGQTPLHRAASKGEKELITLLCVHGAKVDALDRYNATPLQKTLGQRNDEALTKPLKGFGAASPPTQNNKKTRLPKHPLTRRTRRGRACAVEGGAPMTDLRLQVEDQDGRDGGGICCHIL